MASRSAQEKWFEFLIDSWIRAEQQLIEKLVDERLRTLSFSDEASRQAIANCAENPRCVEQLRELLRLAFTEWSLGMMSAFDGDSVLAEEGIELMVGDRAEGEFTDHLFSDFMYYLNEYE